MSKNILQIRHGETPDILLLGNGINRAYGLKIKINAPMAALA